MEPGTGLESLLRACDLQAAGGGILDKFPDACPHPSPQVLVAVARTAMARACELGLLLALLLPMVGTSVPGTVVRLNKAMLSYGKGRDRCAVLHECIHVIPCLYVCVQS